METDDGPHVLVVEEGEGRRCFGPYPSLQAAADAATALAVAEGGLVVHVCPLQDLNLNDADQEDEDDQIGT